MSENISVERAADERIKRVADEAWTNLSVILRVSMDEHSFKTGYMRASKDDMRNASRELAAKDNRIAELEAAMQALNGSASTHVMVPKAKLMMIRAKLAESAEPFDSACVRIRELLEIG